MADTGRSFEETRQRAADTLDDMRQRQTQLERKYINCVKHGAVDAAAEVLAQIESLETEIECEDEMFRQTFY